MVRLRLRSIGFLIATAALVSGAGLMLRAEPPQAVGDWALLGASPDNRVGAAAVPLPDGRTLIAGGEIDGTPTDAIVVFNPADQSFAPVGQLVSARSGHTATLLEDGRVLVAGGLVSGVLTGDLEIIDLSTGTSTLAASMTQLRSGHAAARLPDGKVFIAGGTGTDGVLQSTEIFNPETGAVSVSAPLLVPRTGATATTLIDGRVLVAGGSDGTQDLATAEIFHPASQSFQATDTNLTVPRSGHAAVLLPHNNSVLIVGGASNGTVEASSDLFLPAEFPDPYSYGMGQFAATDNLAAPRVGAVGGPHNEGYAFAVGGGPTDAEIYRFATIKTDKDDYAPGEFAVITGSGWQPNEEVTLRFQEDPAVHDDYVLTVTADGNGNIYWDQWAPEEHDLGVRFYLMARDSRSRAQTTFTDNVSAAQITSPTNASPATITSLPSNVTVNFKYQANTAPAGSGGTPNGTVNIKSGSTIIASASKSLTIGTGLLSDSLVLTIPVGTSNGSYDVEFLITQTISSGTSTASATQTAAVVLNVAPTDTTPPVITPNIVGTLGNNGWYVSDVTVSWSVSDPESTVTSTTGCGSTTINTDTAGTTLTCSATSAGGTASQSVTVKRDATAPLITVQSRTPAANTNGWNNTDVTVVFACSDATSDVVNSTDTHTVTTEGADQSVTGTCTDNAGNTATLDEEDINIDKTAPQITLQSRTPAANTNGWNNTDVTVVFACSDAASGVVSSTDSHTVTTEGIDQSVTGTCTDSAGNTATLDEEDINIDKTAPTISGSRSPLGNVHGWNNTDITVSFICSDGLSGLAMGSPPASTVLSSEGANQSVTDTCYDLAGNSASDTVSGINIDKTTPTISGSRTPSANVNGWNNTNVTVSFTCVDAGSAQSGISTDTVAGATVSAEGMNQSVTNTGTCVDKADNTADPATISGINIDKTAPTISGSRSPLGNVHGWNNTDVTVSFICSDGLSGLAMGSPPASTVLSSEGANQSVTGTCYDLAGNSASDTVSGISIDKTNPTLGPPSFSPVPPIILGGAYTASPNASDTLSGVDTQSCGDVNTSAVGANILNCTATDRAGNVANQSVTYYVVYSNTCTLGAGHVILQPINAEGGSVFKKNSTVPAKFRVCDIHGNSIGTAGVVSSFKLVGIATGTEAPVVTEEIPVSTTPDTAFRWDPAEQQWIFNVNTKNLQVNRTYYYEILLNDLSKIEFRFGLK